MIILYNYKITLQYAFNLLSFLKGLFLVDNLEDVIR